ncbi:MAG: hydroxyethylthiazole kinase [Bacillota bacterium]
MSIADLIREKKPLVHHITNYVTVNDCANTTLAIGALPVMAHSPDEVEDMVSLAQALVLNIGTLDNSQVAVMIKAGQKANSLGIPVVLDPVGAGATPYRTRTAETILNEVTVAAIKGNQGEISVLAGAGGEVKGVESVGQYGDIEESARRLALKQGCLVVVTGVEDIVTDGTRLARIANGHPAMGRVVGTGCMGASVLGGFLAVGTEQWEAAVEAMVFYGVAGELAAELTQSPAAFKIAFLDSLAGLTGDGAARRRRVTTR